MDPGSLLHTWMDGHNLNFKFQEDLKGKLEKISNKTFLNIDTCARHKVHISPKKAISKLLE